MNSAFRKKVAALCVATALFLPACSFSKSQVPLPDSSTPAPLGVPLAEQNNVSPYPILDRLGRWNGTRFAPVTAGSIANGNVIVMTHGWAVGYLSTYEQLQSASSTLVHFWDAGFIDPATNAPLSTGFTELASALQAADPTVTVLFYSWIDQSSTLMSALAAYAPERATEVNGHRMATAIDEVLTDGFSPGGGQVHLIGHSFGANVATTAALALRTAPAQLTLFDSPEVNLARFAGAKNDLRYKLPRLNIGRSAGQTFVDNYISEVGEEYHGYPGLEQIVDTRLFPPPADNGGEKHEFPIGWYAGTTGSSSTVGYRWSPLAGAVNANLGSLYKQNSVTQPLVLEQVQSAPPVGVSSQIGLQTSPLTVASSANTGTIAIAGQSNVTNLAFSTTKDSLWLTFSLTGTAGVGQLDFFIDGRQRSSLVAPANGTGARGQFVILYDVAPGDHVLSIASSGVVSGDGWAIDRLSIVTAPNIDRNLTPPETRSLVVWATVLVVVIVVLFVAAGIWLVVRIIGGRRRRGSQEAQVAS